MRSISLRTLVSVIGLTAAAITSLSMPIGYALVKFSIEANFVAEHARDSANRVARYIYTRDTLWQFQSARLAEIVELNDPSDDVLQQRVFDSQGRMLLQVGAAVRRPMVTRAAPIVVDNKTLGRLEADTSLWPLIRNTAVTAIFGLVLGAGVYFAVRIFPLRVLDRTLAELREDIVARELAQQKILYQATHDTLTGLLSRSAFMERVGQMIEQYGRVGTQFAVHSLDLDRFKDVNDSAGHPVGDDLLRQVAKRISGTIRNSDVAARLGGDEFAILQAPLDGPAMAALLAERVRTTLADPFAIEGRSFHTTASIGIALAGGEIGDPVAMMQEADLALHNAKDEGRDCFRFHSSDLDSLVSSRVVLLNDLRQALTDSDFTLAYQPQVRIKDGAVIGLEALLRWTHSTKGHIPPSTFIPAAELSGLILPLGDWVLHEALRQGRVWMDQGLPPVTIAVNVSAAQFKAENFETKLLRHFAETGFPPGRLEIELTESTLFDVSKDNAAVLGRLRDLGIRIAIDDFGTGYSSLEYLIGFQADHLKIAQVFMKNVAIDPKAASVIRAALGLARDLHIPAIVEGVEQRDDLELLRSWHCAEVQGYIYSRPRPALEIPALLKAVTISLPELPKLELPSAVNA